MMSLRGATAGGAALLSLMLGGCTGGQTGTPTSARAPTDGAAPTPSLSDGGVPAPSVGDAGCELDLSDVEGIRDRIIGRNTGEATWVDWSVAKGRHHRDGTTEYVLVVEEAGTISRTRHGFEAPVRVTLRTHDGRMDMDVAGFLEMHCEGPRPMAFGPGEAGGFHGLAWWESGETNFDVRHPDHAHLTLQTQVAEGVP